MEVSRFSWDLTMKRSFFLDDTFKQMGIWLMKGGLMIIRGLTTFNVLAMIIIHELGIRILIN